MTDKVPYCDENTCDSCKNVFYTPCFDSVAKEITQPKFCPFCGIRFTYTYKTKGVRP